MPDGDPALQIFGVTLIGATAENGRKLLLTLALVGLVLLIAWTWRKVVRRAQPEGWERAGFWSRQALSLILGLFLVLGIISVWFDDPTRLATGLGLVTAGLAFALQRVITATAGYFIILRGKTFNVGDRIVMGGVRGDVISLSFMQTKIMEMGQPPSVAQDDPAMWVRSRQYTGRIVTVSNDKIFDEPVYNYTYHFPYIWEEMRLPVRYQDDHKAAERILIEAAEKHGVAEKDLAPEEIEELRRRYGLPVKDVSPRVYWRLIDNWLELSVRFVSPDHGTRDLKDAMSREILIRLEDAGIGLASATYEIVGLPKVLLRSE